MFVDNFHSLLFGTIAGRPTGLESTFRSTSNDKVLATAFEFGLSQSGTTGKKCASMNRQCIMSGNSRCGGVVVGTGETPVTKTDYKLQSIISHSDMTIEVASLTPFDDEIGKGLMGIYKLTNNTDADIVVREVGLYSMPDGKYYINTEDTTIYYWYCLEERTVLSEPITVPAGGSSRMIYVVLYDPTE